MLARSRFIWALADLTATFQLRGDRSAGELARGAGRRSGVPPPAAAGELASAVEAVSVVGGRLGMLTKRDLVVVSVIEGFSSLADRPLFDGLYTRSGWRPA